MERQRRCGFLAPAQRGRERVVWARGGVAVPVCPVSYITPASQTWLEQYAAWRVEGHRELIGLPARRADAFVLLEEETRREEKASGERERV